MHQVPTQRRRSRAIALARTEAARGNGRVIALFSLSMLSAAVYALLSLVF